ncbi:DinB family protein [Niabella ginsengisoli]|uniref:DinB family protein n=1 Tax=Niabella ginsengisoli TaxID=522298 RepID=A0ABS9SJT8_9BACT|nr:DinB family protein [Niabella ginsengisoli]MCH5598610.1 DinB family protein [Niabella ginsengisoli]
MFDTKEKELVLQSKALQIVIPQYRMHTQLFDNVIADISGVDSLKRVHDVTNHFVWMAGNMVNTRYWLANILGVEDKDPNDEFFKDAKALDLNVTYPELGDLKKQWHRISSQLYNALYKTTDEELAVPYNFGMGVEFVEENKLNMVGMSLDRESYLLGQMGLMRRALGYEGMKYDMDKSINY